MSRYLRALHEAGHAIVAKAVGHEVYLVHIGEDGDYCDCGYPGNSDRDESLRALTALGGYYAAAMFGRGQGYDVNDWDTASQDWDTFQKFRRGRSFSHAKKAVKGILKNNKEKLLELARLVEQQGEVKIDPEPSALEWE